MNVLVGAFVFWTALIPHWIREDGITVLVIDDDEVIYASAAAHNESPRLVQLHSSCDGVAAGIAGFSALIGNGGEVVSW